MELVLLLVILMSGMGGTPVETKTPTCAAYVEQEYYVSTESIQRPMQEELSDYLWNDVQNKYKCAFTIETRKQF